MILELLITIKLMIDINLLLITLMEIMVVEGMVEILATVATIKDIMARMAMMRISAPQTNSSTTKDASLV